MYRLKELVQLVDRNKLQGIDLADYKMETDARLAELYNGVLDDEFRTDEEAMEAIYPDDPKVKNNYSKLKYDLINRLQNLLFVIDLHSAHHNDYQKAYYHCYKEWAAIQIMMGKGARQNAIQAARRLLRAAQRFEFTEIALATCRILRLHYAERLGDAKNFKKYNELYQTLRKTQEYEEEAEELYLMIMVQYLQNRTTKKAKKQLEQLATASYKTIEPYLQSNTSYHLHLYGYLIELMGYSLAGKHKRAIEVCAKAIDFFSEKDFEAHLPLQIFYYRKLNCQIPLGAYEAGLKDATEGLQLLTSGTFNWFKYNESYLILCLHTGDYNKAYEIFNQVNAHPQYKFLEDTAAEIWQIFEAYLYYLVCNKKIAKDDEDDRFSKFRVGRFANSTPRYSKDKRGMNVCILIIQILLLLHDKKYAKVIKKVESIKQYSYRHLSKRDTYRSNLFIRMLPVIPHQHFHKAAVQRHTKSDFEKIKKAPLKESGQTDEIEIIPYEQLWEMVLGNLDNKFHYVY